MPWITSFISGMLPNKVLIFINSKIQQELLKQTWETGWWISNPGIHTSLKTKRNIVKSEPRYIPIHPSVLPWDYSKNCRNRPKPVSSWTLFLSQTHAQWGIYKQPLGLPGPCIHPSELFRSSLVTSCRSPTRWWAGACARPLQGWGQVGGGGKKERAFDETRCCL